MITNFKIYGKLITESVESNLADQFDYDFVEKYYKKHHKIGLDEIISMSSHENIMNCFNGNKYKEDFLRNYSYEFSEFDKGDLKPYIENNLDDEKKIKILEIYNKNNEDEDDEDYEKETEYSSYMLDELDADELREVIEDSREEDDCTDWIIQNWYAGQDGEDLFNELSGFSKKKNQYGGGYSYYKYNKYGSSVAMDGSELYNAVSDYIDTKKLKKQWKDSEDFDYKKDTIAEEIYNSLVLQRHLIKKDPDNVTALIKLWKKNKFNSENIGDEYKFQKAYINKKLEDKMGEGDDEEYKTKLIEDSLDFLYKKFGVNDKIAKEYEPYMWKIEAQYKYNL